MLGRVKLDNTLLTCDKGNFNQITARCRNRTLVTVVRDTCTTTVPPAVCAPVKEFGTQNLKSTPSREHRAGPKSTVEVQDDFKTKTHERNVLFRC